MNRYILATHLNMQEVWVFTAQGLNPKSIPKEKWERRFLNLSETPSLHPFVRCRFWKEDNGGSEVIYFDRSIHSSRGAEKKTNPLVTSFSYQTQQSPPPGYICMAYPSRSKLRKSTVICKNHCRALSSHGT